MWKGQPGGKVSNTDCTHYCACTQASKLYAAGVPSGFFTHIVMDEVRLRVVGWSLRAGMACAASCQHAAPTLIQAGHAEEPLALAGFAGLATAATRVVLAGDPRQLGPIVHSRAAADAGLGLSWMERLLSREPYTPDQSVSTPWHLACGEGQRRGHLTLTSYNAGRLRRPIHLPAERQLPFSPGAAVPAEHFVLRRPPRRACRCGVCGG